LDEPSLGLAPRVVGQIFEVIRTLKKEGLTILLIEQNVKHSLAICHHGIVVENGRIVLTGPGEVLLENDHMRRAYLGL
jgi:branched-chain amino acid transport system ATP-binding protein